MYLSIDNKTLTEWHSEAKQQAYAFLHKWEICFSKKPNISTMQFYRKAYNTYFSISDVLSHLIKYNKLIDKQHCLACKFNIAHSDKLTADFNKFYPLIIKCRDGYKFRKNANVI